MWVGLATFPEMVTLATGEPLATGLAGRALWQGFVQTIGPGSACERCHGVQCCFDSHKDAVKILDQAKAFGLLKFILDPAMFWEMRDEVRLRKSIQRSAGYSESAC
jgi:hypothetical protein